MVLILLNHKQSDLVWRALKAKNFVGFHPHWVVINKVFKNFINSRDRSLEYSLKSIIMILNNEKYNWDILDTNQASNKKFMEDLKLLI